MIKTEWDCPCNKGTIPPYVDDDYYCESGSPEPYISHYEDPVWDSKQCYNCHMF